MSQVHADYIAPRYGPEITIKHVRWPIEPNDAAPKSYVDAHSGGGGSVIYGTDPIVVTTAIGSATVSGIAAYGTTSGYISGESNTLAGDFTFTGEVNITGSDATFIAGDTANITIAGPSTISGNVLYENNTVKIDYTSLMTVACDSTISGNTTVTGDTIFLGDVNISGGDYIVDASTNMTVAADMHITGDQTVTGDVTYEGDLYIDGSGSSITINEGDVVIQGSESSFVVDATSNVTIAGNSTISGDTYMSGDVTMAGNTYITGILEVPTASYGDDSNTVANTEFVQDAVSIANYEAGNGWISGGVIFNCDAAGNPLGTNPSTDYCFSVTPVVVRWTDYTDPLAPVAGLPETIGPFGVFTVPVASRTYTNAGVYINKSSVVSNLTPANSYISAEFGIPTNITKLYGDAIQLGAIVMQNNAFVAGIVSCANPKLMPAYQNNIMAYDFFTLVTPINLGPMTLDAGDATVDTSITCSGGTIWQAMAMTLYQPTNPSRVPIPSKPASDYVYPLFQDTTGAISTNLGAYQPTDPSYLATTVWNNVGVEDLVTVAASSTAWVNSPILYNSSLNLYIQQLPTEIWSSQTEAEANVGKFTRITGLNNETALLNLIGFVTYQVNATDLSAASFHGGEFFNYSVGGGFGGSGGGGGGGITSLIERNTVFIEQIAGADLTGAVGRYDLPFETVSAGLAAITFTVNATSPGHVHMAAGFHQAASAVCPSYISLAGWGLGSTQIKLISGTDPQYITANANVATLTDGRISLRNIRLVDNTGINMDLAGIGTHGVGASMLLDLYDSEIEGTITFNARRSAALPDYSTNDSMRFICVHTYNDITFNGGHYILNNMFQQPNGSSLNTLTVDASVANASLYIIGCYLHNIVINATGTGVAIVKVSSCVILGDITVNGSSASLSIDKASISDINPTLTNGATLTVYDEDELQSNIVWISEVGSDTGYLRDGSILNRAVKTLPQAVSLCSGATDGNEYTIKCFDPMVCTDAATIPAYVSLDAPVMNISGALTLKGNQVIRAKYITGDVTLDAAAFCHVKCDELGSGGHFIGTAGDTYLEVGRLMGTSNSDPIVQAYAGADVIVRSAYIQGLVVATGASASVNLRQVSDIDSVYWSIGGGAVVNYPPHYVSSVLGSSTGLVKLAGDRGKLDIATPGVDYLVGTQNLTLTGEVLASGTLTSTIETTIADNAVKYGQIQTLPAYSVIGNPSSVADNSTSVAFSESIAASTLGMRDANGSLTFLHGTESFQQITKTGTVTLSATHPAILEFVGTDPCTCVMPDTAAAGISDSFKYILANNGTSGDITVTYTDGSPVTTILPLSCAVPICTSSTWEVVPINNSLSLTGDVLGTWAGDSITTALASGVIDVANMGTLPAYSVLGNMSSVPANMVSVPAYATTQAYSVLARDANGNTFTNHISEAYGTIAAPAGSVSVSATSPTMIVVTGSGGNSGTIRLPALGGSILTGFRYKFQNSNNATITIANSTGGALAVLQVGGIAEFISNGTNWVPYQQYPNIVLSGGVTAATALGSSSMTLPITLADPTILNHVEVNETLLVEGDIIDFNSVTAEASNAKTITALSDETTFFLSGRTLAPQYNNNTNEFSYVGTPTISDGKITFTVAGEQITWILAPGAEPGTIGCVRMKFTPTWTGTAPPTVGTDLAFMLITASGGSAMYFRWILGGGLMVETTDSTGGNYTVHILQANPGFTAGVEFEFEFFWNATTGYMEYTVDGTSYYLNSPQTPFPRDSGGALYMGNYYNPNYYCPYAIRDLEISSETSFTSRSLTRLTGTSLHVNGTVTAAGKGIFNDEIIDFNSITAEASNAKVMTVLSDEATFFLSGRTLTPQYNNNTNEFSYVGTPTISDNKVTFTVAAEQIIWTLAPGADPGTTGCVRMKFTPTWTGLPLPNIISPGIGQVIFMRLTGVGGNNDIDLRWWGSNRLWVTTTDSLGSSINHQLSPCPAFTAGVEFEFEFFWNATTGYMEYAVDGTSYYLISAQTPFPRLSTATLYMGDYESAAYYPYAIRDLEISSETSFTSRSLTRLTGTSLHVENVTAGSLNAATQIFTINNNAYTSIICGSCSTVDNSTWVTLCSFAPASLISGTNSSLAVTYNVDVVHQTSGAYGQMTGAYRGFYTSGTSTFAVTTPFTSDIKALDATLSTCSVQAAASGANMVFQVRGPGAFNVKYAGHLTIVQRGLAG